MIVQVQQQRRPNGWSSNSVAGSRLHSRWSHYSRADARSWFLPRTSAYRQGRSRRHQLWRDVSMRYRSGMCRCHGRMRRVGWRRILQPQCWFDDGLLQKNVRTLHGQIISEVRRQHSHLRPVCKHGPMQSGIHGCQLPEILQCLQQTLNWRNKINESIVWPFCWSNGYVIVPCCHSFFLPIKNQSTSKGPSFLPSLASQDIYFIIRLIKALCA